MIGCSCCDVPVVAPVVVTIVGALEFPWGLCRQCWRLVDADRRRVLRAVRLDYRALPFTDQAILFYRAWAACLMQAVARTNWSQAA